ncbi:hypothetical protein U1Q18_037814 [Sarracenia purpurea var. burkii]
MVSFRHIYVFEIDNNSGRTHLRACPSGEVLGEIKGRRGEIKRSNFLSPICGRSKDVGEIKAKVAYFDEGYLTSGEDADVEETDYRFWIKKSCLDGGWKLRLKGWYRLLFRIMSFRHLFRSRSSGQDALRFMASLFDDFLLQELQLLLTKVKTKSPDLDGGDLGLKEKSDKRVPKLEAGQKEEDTVISEMNERIAPPSLMFRSSMNSYRIDLDSGSGEEGEEGISNNIVEKEVDEEEEAIGASRNKGNIETGVAVQAKSNTEVGDEWSFTRLCAVWYRSCC